VGCQSCGASIEFLHRAGNAFRHPVSAKRLTVPPDVITTKPRIEQKDSRSGNPSGYPALLRLVKETLVIGQQKIEQAKVQTYWQTGKYIHEHILLQKDRAQFGKKVIPKLAADLQVSERLIYQTLQFYQSFPILHARAELASLAWTHYRQLCAVEDEKTRLSLMKRAAASSWSERELAEKIRLEVREGLPAPEGEAGAEAVNEEDLPAASIKKLIPKRGALYTYRIAAPASAHVKEDNDRLWIDLGFGIRRRLPESAKGFRAGQIIESLQQSRPTLGRPAAALDHQDPVNWTEKDGYIIRPSKRTEADLFTYKAFIERVIDGDTLAVKIDLGFETEQTNYLRLRGINCPEMTSPAGRKAKRFVENIVKDLHYLIMTSSQDFKSGKRAKNTESDKYGRYLVDVFIPKGKGDVILSEGTGRTKHDMLRRDSADIGNVGKDLVFLNQLLLDERLAARG